MIPSLLKCWLVERDAEGLWIIVGDREDRLDEAIKILPEERSLLDLGLDLKWECVCRSAPVGFSEP